MHISNRNETKNKASLEEVFYITTKRFVSILGMNSVQFVNRGVWKSILKSLTLSLVLLWCVPSQSSWSQSKKYIYLPAQVACSVSDRNGDNKGDEACPCKGTPLLTSAGANFRGGGPGYNGTVRWQIEWDISSLRGRKIQSAAATISTFKGSVDTENTNIFHVTKDEDGLLTPSDFESPVNKIAIPPMTVIPGESAFTFNVKELLNRDLAKGNRFFSIQGRIAIPSTTKMVRGLQIYTTCVDRPDTNPKHPTLLVHFIPESSPAPAKVAAPPVTTNQSRPEAKKEKAPPDDENNDWWKYVIFSVVALILGGGGYIMAQKGKLPTDPGTLSGQGVKLEPQVRMGDQTIESEGPIRRDVDIGLSAAIDKGEQQIIESGSPGSPETKGLVLPGFEMRLSANIDEGEQEIIGSLIIKEEKDHD